MAHLHQAGPHSGFRTWNRNRDRATELEQLFSSGAAEARIDRGEVLISARATMLTNHG